MTPFTAVGTVVEIIGFLVLFFFTYTIVTQLWARVSSSHLAEIIRFPAFCVWIWEIPLLIIIGILIVLFGSTVSLYLWVIYLGFYFALFMIDRYSGKWEYLTPSNYAKKIWRVKDKLRKYKEQQARIND